MSVHFLPPIAHRERPPAVAHVFPRVRGRDLASVPGKKGLPLLGILPEAALDPFAFARRMQARYGPVHRFYACGNWNVQLIGPEANALILADEAGNFSAQGGWKPVFGRHFDGGLLLRDGADHHWHRKLIAAAFKRGPLQSYLDIFAANNARVLAGWSGRAADVYELAQQLSFANGYAAFLGRDPALATRRDMLAFRYLMGSAAAVTTLNLPGTAEARARWARTHIEDLIRPMLAEAPAPERTDLLATLCRMRDCGLIEEREVAAHLTFVVAASFDTLSSGTVATLYHLAANPGWQARVRAELCERIPDRRRIEIDSLGGCEIAERVIKEALRLNAAAPVLWRRAIGPFHFGGHDFPAGTFAGINPMLTHLLPEVWGDPENYDPDRFTPERSAQRHRYSFVPFGGGAHACLGANFAYLQIRALLRILLEGHALRLTSPKPVRWHHWPNCKPRGRLDLALEPIRAPRCTISRSGTAP